MRAALGVILQDVAPSGGGKAAASPHFAQVNRGHMNATENLVKLNILIFREDET